MTDAVPGFDASKFRLGSLCKCGHDFGGSGKSLRYVSTGRCRDCHADYQRQYRQVPANKARARERRQVPANKARARERDREYDRERRQDPVKKASKAEYLRRYFQVPANKARDRERRQGAAYKARAREYRQARKAELEEWKALLAERERKRSRPDQAEPVQPEPAAVGPATGRVPMVKKLPDGSYENRDGERRALKTKAQRRLVELLIAGGEGGVSTAELAAKSPDYVNVFKRMRMDAFWEKAVLPPTVMGKHDDHWRWAYVDAVAA